MKNKQFLNGRFLITLMIILIIWFALIVNMNWFRAAKLAEKHWESKKLIEWWLDVYYQNYWKYPANLTDLESAEIINPIDLITEERWKKIFKYSKTSTWYILTK